MRASPVSGEPLGDQPGSGHDMIDIPLAVLRLTLGLAIGVALFFLLMPSTIELPLPLLGASLLGSAGIAGTYAVAHAEHASAWKRRHETRRLSRYVALQTVFGAPLVCISGFLGFVLTYFMLVAG